MTDAAPVLRAHRLTDAVIGSHAEFRALIGEPAAVVCDKITDRLNPLTRQYVERSPFVLVATSDASGNCDVSPRGDPAGFVRILDDQTVLLPERPGNHLADTLTNISPILASACSSSCPGPPRPFASTDEPP